MAEPYRSHYANGEAVDAALDSGVAAQSEVTGARGSYGNLDARLSAIDTSLSNKANSSNVYTKTQVDTALNDKVSKVTGKGLSTNDYTTVEKTKLAGLQNYDDSSLNGRVTTVEQSVATLNGGASTSGSVANSVAAGVSDAKGYTDTEIGKLDVASVGGAGKYIKSIEQSDGKITAVEETMDSAPTSGSTKAVTSDGIYTDQQRQDAALIAQVDGGAKNLVNVDLAAVKSVNTAGTWVDNVYTRYNIEFTVNADHTVSVRTIGGSATSGASIAMPCKSLSGGTHFLTGCPSGSNSGTNFDLRWGSSGTYREFGDGLEISATGSNNVYARVNTGIDIPTAVVYKPMMCTAADYGISHAFVPYAPTNRELYEMILALQSGRSVQSTSASLMQAGRIDAELTGAETGEDEER